MSDAKCKWCNNDIRSVNGLWVHIYDNMRACGGCLDRIATYAAPAEEAPEKYVRSSSGTSPERIALMREEFRKRWTTATPDCGGIAVGAPCGESFLLADDVIGYCISRKGHDGECDPKPRIQAASLEPTAAQDVDEITIGSAINFLEQSRMWGYADEVRKLESALAAMREERDQARKYLIASERWREAYQDGKMKMYAMGGAVADAAMDLLPCNEGQLDRFICNTYRGKIKEVEAENAKLREERDRSQDALRGMLNQLPSVSCENWHHSKKDRHDGFTPCPVQERWDKAVKSSESAVTDKIGGTDGD